MSRAIKTSPFLGPDGEVVPGSIAEADYVQLGGCEQWVLIRGEDRANPVLIVLHGGRGSAIPRSSATTRRSSRRASRSSIGTSAGPVDRTAPRFHRHP